jgi:hypothetical protein
MLYLFIILQSTCSNSCSVHRLSLLLLLLTATLSALQDDNPSVGLEEVSSHQLEVEELNLYAIMSFLVLVQDVSLLIAVCIIIVYCS